MALCALASVRCGNQPKERTLELSTRGLLGCSEQLADPAATLELTPFGDFQGPVRSTDALSLHDPDALDFPQHTRAVAARALADQGVFLGYVERSPRDSLDLLLWPAQTACRLDTEPLAAPSAGGGQALGYSADAGIVLVVGGNSPTAPAGSVAATTFDSGRGEMTSVTASGDPRAALAEPRAFATVTPLAGEFLVAGGEDPLNTDGSGLAPPSKTAELFDPSSRSFGASRVELTVARSRHSAVTLANGDTLLVGGRGPSGSALNALEVVAGSNPHGSIQGLAALKYPRLFPSALRLDDMRVFVGGGTTAAGTPLSALEWLSADAKQRLDATIPNELPPRHDRAFAALPGGGVLAVGGCEPSSDECGSACRAGCPPYEAGAETGAPVYDAWWIAPNGALTRLAFPIDAPRPVLLGGRDGLPLFASGAPGDNALYRFDPWLARFVPLGAQASAPPRAGLASTALDDGAFVWLSEDDVGASLFGLRASTRNHFAIDGDLISSQSEAEMPSPYPLVPDRPAAGQVGYDVDSKVLAFEAGSEVSVFVAASDYGNFTLDIVADGEPPVLVLGNREFGGSECPWPAGAHTNFRLQRAAERVLLSSGKLSVPACLGPSDRVRLGVKRGQGALLLRSFVVTRAPD